MTQVAITGGDVYTPFRIIEKGVVLVEAGKIKAVGKDIEIPKEAEEIDATGKIVAPGFVDIHIHGGGGGDFMDATREACLNAARYHGKCGTTSMLATTSSGKMEDILRAFETLRPLVDAHTQGAQILGIHMEGPYFAKPEPGCHNADLIHDPDPEEYAPVFNYLDVLKRVTLAPELPGALEFIHRLTQAGVVVSGGHSKATYEEVARAVEAGMTHLTHHWSAMSMVTRVGPKRFSGMVEAGLVRDDLTTELIADGRHLPTSLLRLAYKCKGAAGCALISDAMRAAGLPEGVYEVCGMMAIVEDGVGVTADRKSFASSVITLNFAVRHMVQVVGISLLDAIRMATATPARIVRADHRKGSLEPGKDADLILLDPLTIEPSLVMVRGKEIYTA